MAFELLSNFSAKELYNAKIEEEILATNKKAAAYGLVLQDEEAAMLVVHGKEAIALQERIEFGKSITVKMIEKFMQSTYISQTDYAQTIAALLDVFYEVKEESVEVLTDEEVIEIMYDFFEKESGGDIDTLVSRDMYYLCKKIRYAASGLQEEEDISEMPEDFDE